MAIVGVISRTSSVLFSAADENALAGRPRSLGVDDAMVTQPFPTSAAAMCWLTDPLTNDVVVNYCSTVLPERSSGSVPAGSFAVVTGGSRCSFEIGRGGTSTVLQLVTGAASSLTVVCKFSLIQDAQRWVNCVAAGDLLEVLTAAVPVADERRPAPSPAVARIRAPPTIHRPHLPSGFTSVCTASSQTVRRTVRGLEKPVRRGLVVPRGAPAESSTDSELVMLAPLFDLGADTSSSRNVADADEDVLDLTKDDAHVSLPPSSHGAAPSPFHATGALRTGVTAPHRHQPRAVQSGAPATPPTPRRAATSRVGRTSSLPGGVLLGSRMRPTPAKDVDHESLAQKRYKTMINGGFIGGSVVMDGPPERVPALKNPEPPLHEQGVAAPKPDGANSFGLGRYRFNSLASGHGSGRRGDARSRAGVPTVASTSTRALTWAAPPAAGTSASSACHTMTEAPIPEVPVGAPAVPGLSTRAALGHEAPNVRAGPLGLLARVDN